MDAPQLETCRCCANCFVATTEVDFVHLFQTRENLEGELKFIQNEIDAWSLKISPNDGLPQKICANCFTKFCTIQNFRQECAAAQNLLRKAGGMVENTIELTAQEQFNANILDIKQNQQQQSTFFLTTTSSNNEESIFTDNVTHDEQTVIKNKSNNEHIQVDTSYTNSNTTLNFNDVLGNNTSNLFNVVESAPLLVNGSLIDATSFLTNVVAQEADTTTQSSTEDNATVPTDLEDMLKGTVIPKKVKENVVTEQKLFSSITQKQGQGFKNKFVDDIEADFEENIPKRIANFQHACNYCYCPPDGPIGHLIFKTSDELSQHFFDVHDPQEPYPCPKCTKLFVSMRDRNCHIEKQHGTSNKKIVKCRFCRKILRSPQEVHENNCNFVSNWHCRLCGKDFLKSPLHVYRAHQRSHDTSKQHRCDICQRYFLRYSNLVAHKEVHLKNFERDYIKSCIECGEVFGTIYDLKRHEYNAHNGKALFRCEYCDRGYSTVAFLRRHKENAHANATNLQGSDQMTCPICSTTFQSKLKLHYHMQRPKDENGDCVPIIHTPKIRSKEFSCSHCPKHFPFREDLETHKQIHDENLRPFACSKCKIRCRTSSDLKQHVRIAHSAFNILSCDICGKKFAYSKDLETHMLYHSKLKFSCKFKGCTQFCNDENSLLNHMREHETVTCEHCGQLFTPNEIEAHKKTVHTVNTRGGFIDITSLTDPIINFNVESKTFECYNDPMKAVNPADIIKNTGNVCVQYIQPQKPNLLRDHVSIPAHVEQKLMAEHQESFTNGYDINIEGVPTDDYFISSLLDPENEIIVS